MPEEISEKEMYELARKRVEEKKGFYIHFAIYVIVNTILVLIWAFPAGGGYPWFIWPLGGWGIGILFHFLGVFVFSRHTKWEQKEIEKEVDRMKKSGR